MHSLVVEKEKGFGSLGSVLPAHGIVDISGSCWGGGAERSYSRMGEDSDPVWTREDGRNQLSSCESDVAKIRVSIRHGQWSKIRMSAHQSIRGLCFLMHGRPSTMLWWPNGVI